MKLTIASKVTIARICLIPVFIVCYHLWGDLSSGAIPAAVFVLASMTDWVDGYLAHSRNEVTNFGKFMDPIADKLLVMSAFVLLVGDGRMTGVSCIIILAREFIISGFRLVASDSGIVIAAKNAEALRIMNQKVKDRELDKRYLAVIHGVMMLAAGKLGKIKTTLQIIAIVLLLLNNFPFVYIGIPMDKIVLAAAVVMTVWSGADYIVKNRQILKD